MCVLVAHSTIQYLVWLGARCSAFCDFWDTQPYHFDKLS